MNVQDSTLSFVYSDNDKTYNNIKMKDRTMKMVVAALIAATVGLVSCIKFADGAGENSENGSGNGGNGTPPSSVEGAIDGLVWATSNCGATTSSPEGKYYSADEFMTACPSGWRVPTSAELRSLCSNASEFSIYKGLKGIWLSGKKSYSSSVSAVFFPAAGYKESSGTLRLKGSVGIYWSSTKDGAYEVLYIGSEDAPEVGVDQDEESSYQLRCVKK